MIENMITQELEIQKRGASLTLTVTKIVRLMDLDVGDKVVVTIMKKEE